MKIGFVGALLALPFLGMSQIDNKSFEGGDADSVAFWNIKQGTAGVTDQLTFNASTGDTTITAVDGDSFVVLRPLGSEEGVLKTRFSLKKSPAAFLGDFIYLNDDINQRFSIEITYLKWIPSRLSNDTVMHVVERINPNVSADKRNYNWLQFEVPINRNYFRYFDEPDSCTITFRTHAGDAAGSSGSLILDHLYFSSELINGITSPEGDLLAVYPNPSSGHITVDGLEEGDRLSIIDLTGRVFAEKTDCGNAEQFDDLPRGLYLLTVERNGHRNVQRFTVQ